MRAVSQGMPVVNIRLSPTSAIVNDTDDAFMRYRIAYSLHQKQAVVDEVVVHLREIHAFALAYIHQCVVEVKLNEDRVICADSSAVDLQVAIHRAAARAECLLANNAGRPETSGNRYQPADCDRLRAGWR